MRSKSAWAIRPSLAFAFVTEFVFVPNEIFLQSYISCPGYRKSIVDGEATFAELASKYSDCSSAHKGGNLGPFGRGQMQVSTYREATKVSRSQNHFHAPETVRRCHLCPRNRRDERGRRHRLGSPHHSPNEVDGLRFWTYAK